jgi:geranylgeranyl pyrophosphate synthase
MAQPPPDAARQGWIATKAAGALAGHAATLAPAHGRGLLRAEADRLREAAAPLSMAALRARIASRPSSVFIDWSRDAAEAFGDAEAALAIHPVLAAVIEGIKIIDDIQDGETRCLAAEVGVERAIDVALAAIGEALGRTAELPFDDRTWSAAALAVGRGIRETARGQEMESTATGSYESYWNVVDHKTPPLVATALELGALAAGADPLHAAALTQLAVPLGRVLQIGDDANDALGDDATDWRTPQLNLLMLYSLSGPDREELGGLLRRGHDRESLRAAQLLMLRDGALGYAVHALTTTLAAMDAAIESLALPDRRPLLRLVAQQREGLETVLRSSGVDEALARSVTK